MSARAARKGEVVTVIRGADCWSRKTEGYLPTQKLAVRWEEVIAFDFTVKLLDGTVCKLVGHVCLELSSSKVPYEIPVVGFYCDGKLLEVGQTFTIV